VKKKRNIALHTKIVIGLVLGVIFGSIFHISPTKLLVNSEGSEKIVKDWTSIRVLTNDSLVKEFDSKSQISVIKYFTGIKDAKVKESLKMEAVYPDGRKETLQKITSVKRERTIGVMLKPLGDIFIRLLSMIAVPLVLASLIVGAASLSDIKHIAKIGGKTLGFYALTAVMAISIGLVLANIIQPGKFMSEDSKERLTANVSGRCCCKD
jgi:L-cystine uptake protein TcyP (sodium:dicarboxylate symporter family)